MTDTAADADTDRVDTGMGDIPGPWRRLRRLAAGGQWAAICQALHPAPPDRCPLPVIPIALNAAIEQAHEPLLDWAVGAAIARDLPARMRAMVASRLVRAGRPDDGWAVLTADPATVWDPTARGFVGITIAHTAEHARASPALRAAARALGRRIFGNPLPAPAIAPFRIPEAGPAAPPAFPVALRLAPGVEPSFGAEIQALVDDNERSHGATEGSPIDVFEDVYLDRGGLIWRRDGRVFGREPSALRDGAAAAMATAPFVAAGEHATGATRNFFHWFGAWLPGLCWRLAPGVPRSLPILIRDDAPAFQTESLKLAFGADVPILPVGAAVRVGMLYQTRDRGTRLDPAGPFEPMIARIVAAAQARGPYGAPCGPRIYISRRDTAHRPLGNEAALEGVLAAMGFAAVTMTGRPLLEQIAIVRGASAIVAPHGAGLSLLLFARPGTSVFELIPAMPSTMSVRLCMTRISRARGHRHLAWLEPWDDRKARWSCSIPAMIPALEAFLADA